MFRIMMYGPAGVGVQQIAERAPSPVVIQTVDACDCSCPRYDVSRNMRLNDAVDSAIASEEYKTIVINNVSGLERMIFDFEFGRKVNPYEQGYCVGDGRLQIRFRQVLDKIIDSGKNLIVLADSAVVNMPGVFTTQPVPCIVPNANRCLFPLINDMLEAVIPVVLVESADGHIDKRIILKPRPSVMARMNMNLMSSPEEWMEFDGRKFFKGLEDAG